MGLLSCLDLEDSEFRELPTFFEVSHLAMDLTVTDSAILASAQSIADALRTELSTERGVELEVLVRARSCTL